MTTAHEYRTADFNYRPDNQWLKAQAGAGEVGPDPMACFVAQYLDVWPVGDDQR